MLKLLRLVLLLFFYFFYSWWRNWVFLYNRLWFLSFLIFLHTCILFIIQSLTFFLFLFALFWTNRILLYRPFPLSAICSKSWNNFFFLFFVSLLSKFLDFNFFFLLGYIGHLRNPLLLFLLFNSLLITGLFILCMSWLWFMMMLDLILLRRLLLLGFFLILNWSFIFFRFLLA